MSNQKKLPTLEESLTEITGLINTMEQSDSTLEQSLDNFERGIALVKHCQKILGEAEQKVQILMQNNQQEVLVAFGEDMKEKGLETNENCNE